MKTELVVAAVLVALFSLYEGPRVKWCGKRNRRRYVLG